MDTFNPVPKFKIRHVYSGLFYKPNAGYKGLVEKKTNLSKKGKVYEGKPDITQGIEFVDLEGNRRKSRACEWVVIEVRG